MTHTARSRRQLELGKVIKKWDGTDLITTKDGKAVINRKKRTSYKKRKRSVST